MEPYWIIAAPLLAALLAPSLVKAAGSRAAGVILSLVPFLIAGWLLSQALADGPVPRVSLPQCGFEIDLRAGALFITLPVASQALADAVRRKDDAEDKD